MTVYPRILVVEDEVIIALALKVELTRAGYPVCGIAARGEDAVRMALELLPDVILMDVGLKGNMDGIAAVDLLRAELKQRALQDIPVIFVSGYLENAAKESQSRCSQEMYLSKPVSLTHLRQALESIFHQ